MIRIAIFFLASLLSGFSALSGESPATPPVVTIGFGTNKPPYVIEAEARGLEVDIVLGAARHAGYAVKPYFAPMERLHTMLAARQIDGISATSPATGIQAFYSAPCLPYHNIAVALAERKLKIASVGDLGRYSVSAFQRARDLLGPEFHAMAAANPLYREERNQVVRNLLLYSRRVDVVVGDRRIVDYFTRHPGANVDTAQALTWYDIFPPSTFTVAFTDSALRDSFDLGLAAFKADGGYAAVEKRYSSE